MGRWIIIAGMSAGAIAVSMVCLSRNAPARPADSEAVPPTAQQLARMVSAYEILKHHFQVWEGTHSPDANIGGLATEMCDAIAQNSNIGVTWTSRHFPRNASARRDKPNDFEQRSMRRLQGATSGPREIWSDDHTQYVRAVSVTHVNCTRCHETKTPGANELIGFTSVTFSKELWR